MNEEHFLTELKIYLSPLSKDKLTAILQLFAQLFDEGRAGDMSEEAIAKALGKPKEIAQEILQFYHVKVKEKEIYQNDWREIPPQYEDDDFEEDDSEVHSMAADRPFLPRFLMLLFHLFVGIWFVLSVYLVLFSAWAAVFTLIITAILSAGAFLSLPLSAALFAFFIGFILLGIALFLIAIGRPITGVFNQLVKHYLRFAHRVIREGR